MMKANIAMAPSPRQSGVLRITGLHPHPDTAVVRGDTDCRSTGSPHDPPDLSGDDGPGSFKINFTNIRGLAANHSSVEHHLATSSPNLLLLSETQVAWDASDSTFQIPQYNLISRFRYKGGVCAYYNINTPVARLMDLESPNFDAIWLKICLPTKTIIICFCYCPYSNFDHLPFFHYLSTCHESLQTSHPNAEILYIGDFNVHHTEWLSSTHNDAGGREAYHFSLLHDLEQIIQHPTRIPDRHDQASNILDLFFTSNPHFYNPSISSPLGNSDHCLV
ncbi:MAG: endonuclease/exonuclease/phosphatase family protein, partial [Bacteroidota bacterium]